MTTISSWFGHYELLEKKRVRESIPKLKNVEGGRWRRWGEVFVK